MYRYTSKVNPWWVFIGISILATITPQFSTGGYGFNYAYNALVLIAVSVSLVSMMCVKKTIVSHHLFPLMAIMVLLFLPVLWTESDVTAAVLRFSFILITLFWVFLLPDIEAETGQLAILRSILVLIVIQAVYALVLYFVLIPMDVVLTGNNSRIMGIFMQPNVLASLLATGVILGGYLYSIDATCWAKRLAVVALVLLPAAIMLIESKAGLLGMAVGLAVLFFAISLTNRKKLKVIVALIFFGVILGFFIGYIDAFFLSGSQRTVESHIKTTHLRLGFYIQSLKLIGENPLGVGFGKFAYSFMDSWIFDLSPYLVGEKLQANLFHPHNEILYLGVEGGITTILAIGLLFLYTFKCAISRQALTPFLMKLSLLCPIAIHSMLEYPFYHSFLHWALFIVLLRIFLGSYSTTNISKLYPVSIGLLLFVFSVTGIQTTHLLNQYRIDTSKNINALSGVVNPWVLKDEIHYAMQITRLNAAIELRNKDMIRSELEHAYAVLAVIPQANLLTNMVQAHLLLGEIEKAEKLLVFINASYLNTLGREGESIKLTEFDMN